MTTSGLVTADVLRDVLVEVLTKVITDLESKMATKGDIKRVEDKIDTINGKVNDIVDNTKWLRGESPLADEDAA